MKGNGDPAKRKLIWKLTKGNATAAQFGFPVTATSYALCVYDDGVLVMNPVVEAGGTCRTRTCWKDLRGQGFAYKNGAANRNGITDLKLRAGAGKAAIQVMGKGANLTLPLPVAQKTAVTVQLVKNAGAGPECWEAVFPAPARRNDAAQFDDRLP